MGGRPGSRAAGADDAADGRAGLARYGRHRSFAGWYIPFEPGDYLAVESVGPLKAFYRETSDLQTPVGRQAGRVRAVPDWTDRARSHAETYTDLLTDSAIDIVMLQDGVGARKWDDDVESKVRPLFRAMRDACLTAGVQLWADVEVFHNVGTVDKPGFVPADTARLGRQLAAEAPFVFGPSRSTSSTT